MDRCLSFFVVFLLALTLRTVACGQSLGYKPVHVQQVQYEDLAPPTLTPTMPPQFEPPVIQQFASPLGVGVPPPHRVIAAPNPLRSGHDPGSPHGSPLPQTQGGPPGQTAALPNELTLLPTPGVTNDPGAYGPGYLGMGQVWIHDPPKRRPTIPNATIQPMSKSPYSYGHFGNQGKRHWSRQHGYSDRSLQWTLR